jgi:uncharacterized protein YrrD
VIERGWAVVDRDGDEVGHVDELVGDTNADIFNGLSVSTGLLSGTKYVPAESVGSIVEGRVQLSLDAAAFKRLGDYDEPPPSEEILTPDPTR